MKTLWYKLRLLKEKTISIFTHSHFTNGGLLQKKLKEVGFLGLGRRVIGLDHVRSCRHKLQHNKEKSVKNDDDKDLACMNFYV